MEHVYHTTGGGRKRAAPRRVTRRKGQRQVALGTRERKRLSQLLVCTVLFLTVFIGRGVFPGKVNMVREELLRVIQADTDFKAVFSDIGQAVGRGEPFLETLRVLWDGEGSSISAVWQPYHMPEVIAAPCRQELAFLGGAPTVQEFAGRYFAPKEEKETDPEEQTEVEGTKAAVEESVYDGPPLPEYATMEKLSLGLDEEDTAAPVMAVVSSEYGWREHPIDQEEKFHAGVDLAANYGEPIGAFADGVVDYIGESPAYGQYLQLRHAGGVTTFYAHCSKLCVQQGQSVQKGEKVAEVGDTGNTTGAHLHFEIKLNGQLLNPLYYIETE